MKALLTGASGFLGSYVTNEFNGRLHAISLRGNQWIEHSFSSFQAIIHLAGKAHDMDTSDTIKYFEVNTQLTLKFATKAKEDGVKHFIFISTIKVYGEGGESTIDEMTKTSPSDAYGESKLMAEKLLLEMSDQNFIVSIIRPPLIYGKNVKGNLQRILKMCEFFPILPLARINNRRSMVYAGNVASMIKRIVELQKPGIYIPLDSKSYSTSELIRKICANLNKNTFMVRPWLLKEIIRITMPSIYQRLFGNFEVNNDKSRSALNWEPPYSFAFGLSDMVINKK